MPISADFTIDYVNQIVYHSSGTAIYTVNELYSYLQSEFDNLTQLDDTIPMSAQTPTAYTLINGWYMGYYDATLSDTTQYLKEGAVETIGWNSVISVFEFGGTYTSAVDGDIGREVGYVGGTPTDTGTLLGFDNTAQKWWVRTTAAFSNTATAIDLDDGTGTGTGILSVASSTGEALWPNIYTLGTIEEDDSQQIYVMQNSVRIYSGSEWWPEGGSGTQHIDILLKTREAGTEVDNGLITVFLRHYLAAGNADLYDHFEIDLTNGGRNAVPLSTSPDLNNTSQQSTVSTYSDITIAFVNGTIDYQGMSGTFTDFEVVTGGISTATGLFLYSTSTSGTGTMTLGNINGTFQAAEVLTGGTSTQTCSSTTAVTGEHELQKAFSQGSSYSYSVIVDCATRTVAQVYEYFKYVTRIGSTFTMYPTTEVDGPTTSWATQEGQLYITANVDNQTTADFEFALVKASPFGTFAGGKLFGAQGVWVENMDNADIQAFQLRDSRGNIRTPPNQITVSVTNTLTSDRVAVFRSTGSSSTTPDKSMFTSAANNSTSNTAFIITTAIPADTPAAGSVRIVDISDTSSTREIRHTYTSWSGSTFSGLSPALDRLYTASSDTAYVPYIDDEATGTSISSNVIYASDRYVVVRVRRYQSTAILPFEVPGQITSGGYSVATIRTDDTIVN